MRMRMVEVRGTVGVSAVQETTCRAVN